jgi:2-polyprenyl-3-methyl-5-hydroxy-6-metoxy-1,4-benzoquinol methylase
MTTTTFENPYSMICCAEHFDDPFFQSWRRKLSLPDHLHRKWWEYVYVARVLERCDMLAPGKRGLGFAVGKEPLPAAFADCGCEILMTDLPGQATWKSHAATRAVKHERVSFRRVDMKEIPADLAGQWDFVWSCCAFEHLGNAAAGLSFVMEAMKCLKPGGIAVHTTEYNLSSNDRTNDNCGSVMYRRRDMQALRTYLCNAGYLMAPLDVFSGDRPEDWDIGHLHEENGYLKRLVIPAGHKQLRVRTTPTHKRIAAPIGFIGTSIGFYAQVPL